MTAIGQLLGPYNNGKDSMNDGGFPYDAKKGLQDPWKMVYLTTWMFDFKVDVGKYTIHGFYGHSKDPWDCYIPGDSIRDPTWSPMKVT